MVRELQLINALDAATYRLGEVVHLTYWADSDSRQALLQISGKTLAARVHTTEGTVTGIVSVDRVGTPTRFRVIPVF